MGLFFNKVKIKKNDKVAYYKFAAKFCTSDKIADLCQQTQISNFFVEVYGLTQNEISVAKEKLLDGGFEIAFNSVKRAEWIVISIPVSRIKDLLQSILEIDFEEILIWDCYTTIDQFLINGQNFSISNSKNNESKFYLSYNKYENSYAELYLNPTIDSQDIQKILTE